MLETLLSDFNNLPHFTKNIMPEVEDVYGKYCDDEITEEELFSDPNKYINFLLSYIEFIRLDMMGLYIDLEDDCHKYQDIIDEMCGDE